MWRGVLVASALFALAALESAAVALATRFGQQGIEAGGEFVRKARRADHG